MNKTKIAILGIAVLFAVLTVSTASAHVTLYFVPQDSSVPEGECHSAYVEVWASVEDPDTMQYGQFAIHYDPSCVNITDHPVMDAPEGWGSWIDNSKSSWNAYPQCGGGPGYDMIMYFFWGPVPSTPPPFDIGPAQMIANFTVHCDSSEYCVSELSVSCGEAGCFECPIQVLTPVNENLYPDSVTLDDGTFTCGEAPPAETFEKTLLAGWNLISLPLTNATDMTVANIIDASLTGNYDALHKYDATTHSFVPLSSGDTMANGVGYFIHITTADTWTYSGSAYTTMSASLSGGLNMVGWLNCSKTIGTVSGDALYSIKDNYYYVASWNATAQEYETYNPVAPSVFNNFTTMDRGEGYFISAKGVDTLSESC